MTAQTTSAPQTTSAAPAPAAVATEIAKLTEGAKLADVIAKINELVEKANTKRDRGPESSRIMTEDDAKRIMLGDLKDASHTKAAETLGLSYGQVYSARKGFTFKPVYQKSLKISKS